MFISNFYRRTTNKYYVVCPDGVTGVRVHLDQATDSVVRPPSLYRVPFGAWLQPTDIVGRLTVGGEEPGARLETIVIIPSTVCGRPSCLADAGARIHGPFLTEGCAGVSFQNCCAVECVCTQLQYILRRKVYQVTFVIIP